VVRIAAAVIITLVVAAGVLIQLPAPASAGGDGAALQLSGVNWVLYPRANPRAEWRFDAETIDIEPRMRTSVVTGIRDGRRLVDGTTDIELASDEVAIDSQDNFRMATATIYLPEHRWTITLGRTGAEATIINQRTGYASPFFHLAGENVEATGTNFRSDFDLEEASWDDPVETFTQEIR
jgi:hypothetical protein